MKKYIFLIVLLSSVCTITFLSCEKNVFGGDTSDIDIKLSSSSYAISNGDEVTLELVVTNLGPDAASDLEVQFKQANTALKFIDGNREGYDRKIWTLDGMEANHSDTLRVRAVAKLPDLLPTLQVVQSAFVIKNINYDGNASNNQRIINVAIIE